jgi:uncharacterized protein
MKILIHLAHPAQYHMFKYIIRNLIQKGHSIKVTINTKDILEQLLIEDGVSYENILHKRRLHNTKLSTFLTLLKKDCKIFQIQIKGKYDLFVGTETALAHIGWLLNRPSLIMDEDDISVIPEVARISFPFATHIVAPVSCNLGKWSKKKISYSGFQKTAYLHPDYFKPQGEIVKEVLKKKERFFLIRVSDLSAYHDNGIKGFTEGIIRETINLLLPFGEILISTEKILPEDLNMFILKTKVSDIHHFLYYADFIIADSQSMCVEAALLGTPSIRFSDFVGKIGVLEELEYKYGLTYGVKITQQEKLFEKIRALLNTKELKKEWQVRRLKMLEDKIDVTSFWTWLIDCYPESVSVLRKDPDFQYTFSNSMQK